MEKYNVQEEPTMAKILDWCGQGQRVSEGLSLLLNSLCWHHRKGIEITDAGVLYFVCTLIPFIFCNLFFSTSKLINQFLNCSAA